MSPSGDRPAAYRPSLSTAAKPSPSITYGLKSTSLAPAPELVPWDRLQFNSFSDLGIWGQASVSVQASKATKTVHELDVKTWEGPEAFVKNIREAGTISCGGKKLGKLPTANH